MTISAKIRPEDNALLEALETGDLKGVEAALEAGAEANILYQLGVPTLHLALKGTLELETREAIFRKLLEAGADPNRLDTAGAPALFEAAGLGYEECCRMLIDAGARLDIEIRGSGETLLYSAARGGLLWLVEKCLEAGLDANQENEHGVRPIHHAAEATEAAAIIGFLVDAGADPNVVDKMGLTPLANAAARGPASAVAVLLKLGLDPEARFWQMQMTPLMLAVTTGRLETAKTLLEHGVNASSADTNGWTALHHAARTNQPELVTMLLKHGADPKALTTKELTLDAELGEIASGSTAADVASQVGAEAAAATLSD